MRYFSIQNLVLTALLSVFLLSCSDDDPVSTDDDHFEAIGMFLRESGVEFVRVENGEVTGEIEVGEGVLSPLISINFLLEEGGSGTPTEDNVTLGWQIADESVVEVVQHEEDGNWRFHVRGLEHGETTIVFSVLHNDHADFVSPPIPVHVVEEDGEVEAVGLVLQDEESGDELVRIESGQVTGSIALQQGQTSDHIAVRFLDEDGHLFTPSDEHFSLDLIVEDEAIATAAVEEGEPFVIRLTGVAAGSADLTVRLLHDDHADFVSPQIPIAVQQ